MRMKSIFLSDPQGAAAGEPWAYTSTSGRSGMEMSTSICPDLILMDAQLPIWMGLV